MQRVPMTAAGAKALQAELQDLKVVQRPKVIQAIAEARAHGDLRENAEYHAAREQQSFVEGRIKEIESKLSHAQIIDVSKMSNTGKAIFGSTIHIVNLTTDAETVYQIVGDDEANVKNGKISVSSPIARALIGKEVGDEIRVETPTGISEYEIVKVEYV